MYLLTTAQSTTVIVGSNSRCLFPSFKEHTIQLGQQEVHYEEISDSNWHCENDFQMVRSSL